jgi:hypothetical protein
MSRKRIVLLAIIAVLAAAIAIEYGIKAGQGKAERISFKGKPDEIVVAADGATYHLTASDGGWLVRSGEGTAYPADAKIVEEMARELRELRLIDRVSNRDLPEQYGLTDEEAVHVSALGKGKTLREIWIGKQSPVGGHAYVRIGGEKGVFLSYSDLRRIFGRDLDGLRNKLIFSVDPEEVERVTIEAGSPYTLFDDPETGVWKVAGMDASDGEAGLDQEKVTSFIRNCSALSAKSFPLDARAQGEPLCNVILDAAGKRITLPIYPKEGNQYLCASSETPYLFTVIPYHAEKYMKELDSFRQK